MAGPTRSVDARQPVLVGLGSLQRSGPVVELMTEAARASGRDCGADGLLSAVERIVVPQGSWSLRDPARIVARRIGAARARTTLCEVGVSQQEVINDALAAIAGGECDTVLVLGGEARAWERANGTEPEADDVAAPGEPDEVRTRPADFVAPIERAAGIVLPPVLQYAMIENALGAAEGRSPEQQRHDIAALWGRFNVIARQNADAAFATPRDAGEIATASRANRPLAFPYNRWHASQWTLDQASALLFCSARKADEAGVPIDRRLYAHVALHCSRAVTLSARRALHEWPAMTTLGRAAEAHLGRTLRDLRLAEVYSCFPAAVRVQQRALTLDPDATPTVTGGMPFAGGPFNHFVLLATAAVGQRLRHQPDEVGLVTTVSGMLSKPGLALWSATPPAVHPLLADLADEAMRATALAPVAEAPPAVPTPATVASYTVTFGGEDGLEPLRTLVVADLPDGVRTAATCEDAATAALAVREGLVGRAVEVKDTTFSL